MPNFIQTVIYRLRKPDPVAGNKIDDFAAIIDALADDVDAALGTSIFASGDLKVTAAAVAPSGWLTCDGSAVSRSAYPGLFAAVGTAYGNGDGSTTFNVPDYRGRVILGAGAGPGLTPRARGQAGGEEVHTLSIGELPEMSDGGHPLTDAASGTHWAYATSSTGGPSIAIASNGLGVAHNNLQPFGVAQVLIKT